MAVIKPNYVTPYDVNFNDTPVDCILFTQLGYLVQWKKLSEIDKKRFVDAIIELGGAPELISSLNDLNQIIVDTTGLSMLNTYGFVFEKILSKPPSPKFVTNTNIAYHTSDTVASSGYQQVLYSDIAPSSPTGLTDDVTEYTAVISVDTVDNNISVVGSVAQTIADLIVEIQADLVGATITLLDTSNVLHIQSNSTGITSVIAITDTDLFGSVTGYDSIGIAVDGVDSSTGAWLKLFDGSAVS